MGARILPEQRITNLKSFLEGSSIEIIRLEKENNAKSLYRFLCLKHKKEWVASYDSVRRGSRCPFCSVAAKVIINDVIDDIKRSLSDKNIIVKDVLINNGSKSMFLLKCIKDGYEWKTSYASIYAGAGCPKCGGNFSLDTKGRYDVLSNSLKNRNIFVNRIIKNDASNSLYELSCESCDYIWESTYRNSMSKRNRGCPRCAGNIKLTKSERELRIKDAIKNRGIELIDIVLDNATKSYYKFKCNKGHVWEAPYYMIVRQKTGCPYCNESKGEDRVIDMLTKLNISYVRQYKFSDCANKNHLRFDFFLPDFNCCIEFQGIQHFEPVKMFGGISALQYTQMNDKIKNEYCKNNNIRLIRIVDEKSKYKNFVDGSTLDLPDLVKSTN